jgi:GWxTD domain-containing protein
MKTGIIILIALSGCLISAGELGIFIDSNRFFGAGGNVQFEINYSFPYHAVDFMKGDYGPEAEVFVDIAIKRGEKLVSSDSFTNKIIISDPVKAYSAEEYLDKITITLPVYNFELEIEFIDVHTENSYVWKSTFEPLDPAGMVSDLELSAYVKADTTEHLAKFHRNGRFFKVMPNHTFQNETGSFSYYQQLRDLFEDDAGNYQLEQDIIISSEGILVDSIHNSLSGRNSDIVELEGTIPVAELEEGYYELMVKYKDAITGRQDRSEDYFCLNTRSQQTVRLFPELEDDIKLASYFLNTNEKSVLKTLTLEGKENYLNRFWNSRDPNPASPENEFLEQVKERVHYANQFFSHFKPGWTTDMGRIYIKYGKPYEIRKLTTNLGEHEFSESKDYSYDERASAYYYNKYTVKNYEIWKYRMQRNANYIFFDVLTSGDYKLIYSSDDNDGENSLTDWKSYLGYDFDERLLD